jgi:hypothetical protein
LQRTQGEHEPRGAVTDQLTVFPLVQSAQRRFEAHYLPTI